MIALGTVAVLLLVFVGLFLGTRRAAIPQPAPAASAADATPGPSTAGVAIGRASWVDGATDGWVSPNMKYVVAKLADGLGMYKVVGSPGSPQLVLVRRVTVSAGSGKWLEDSSGFAFDGLYGQTLEQRRISGPLPITFELEVLETTGLVTHLQSNVPMYTAQFSYLSPDGTTVAVTGACCPSYIQVIPRAGGPSRDLVDGSFFLIGWDNLGRVVYAATPDLIAARAPGSSTDGFNIAVPIPADAVLGNVGHFSMSPDRTAVLLQAGTSAGADQRWYIVINGRLVDLPTIAPPTSVWLGGHELLLNQYATTPVYGWDVATGWIRALPATFEQGLNIWRATGSYLLWQLRGTYRVTDLETGAMRFIDLPASDGASGSDFGVTEPGHFAILSTAGVAFIDAKALMDQPAPSNQLRDRPTVGTTHVPSGLELPPLCRYVEFHDNLSSWDWAIDCGEGQNVRATLALNLEHAGWASCTVAANASTLVRDDRQLVVTDSAGPQLPMSMVESSRLSCPR